MDGMAANVGLIIIIITRTVYPKHPPKDTVCVGIIHGGYGAFI